MLPDSAPISFSLCPPLSHSSFPQLFLFPFLTILTACTGLYPYLTHTFPSLSLTSPFCLYLLFCLCLYLSVCVHIPHLGFLSDDAQNGLQTNAPFIVLVIARFCKKFTAIKNQNRTTFYKLHFLTTNCTGHVKPGTHTHRLRRNGPPRTCALLCRKFSPELGLKKRLD